MINARRGGPSAGRDVRRWVLPRRDLRSHPPIMSESRERAMWAVFEPIHVVTYFSAQARDALTAAGLRGFWRGYFAGRAAPLGPVPAAPVLASFFSFAPSMVTRALPEVWTMAAPELVLKARSDGAVA